MSRGKGAGGSARDSEPPNRVRKEKQRWKYALNSPEMSNLIKFKRASDRGTQQGRERREGRRDMPCEGTS